MNVFQEKLSENVLCYLHLCYSWCGDDLSYHSSVPHHRHPLLNPVCSLWDQSEVILADGFLSCGEAGMSTGRHLEVSTGKNIQQAPVRFTQATWIVTETWSHTNHANKEVRYCGVEGSGLRGGLMTKAAAVAQSLDQ